MMQSEENRMEHPVFISYSHNDKDTAAALARELEGLEVPYFLDTKDNAWGESITDGLHKAMQAASAIVVIVSPASVKSHWLSFELGYAIAMNKPILPFVTHRSIELPDYLRGLRVSSDVREA